MNRSSCHSVYQYSKLKEEFGGGGICFFFPFTCIHCFVSFECVALFCTPFFCHLVSEFYQTGQLSFMTQADSLSLENNCREDVFL